MLKQALLTGTTILLSAACVIGTVYLWWQSTPQYALLEVRRAYADKDRLKFNKYVDVASLAAAFTEEIIFASAEKTPGLTTFQRVIGLGAIMDARPRIDNSLIFQIQKLVSGSSSKDFQCLKRRQEAFEKQPSGDATYGTIDGLRQSNQDKRVNGLAKNSTLAHRWRQEKERLKKAAFERISEYAGSHPHTLINRIFAAPVGRRANAVKEILAESGFRKANFRAYRLEKKGGKFVAHLSFFSPRIDNQVTVRLELERVAGGPFGYYRIFRLVDIKRTLSDLNYDTDRQIHGLVAYGLQGICAESVVNHAKEVVISNCAGKDEQSNDSAGTP